jgi:hypothetical protein
MNIVPRVCLDTLKTTPRKEMKKKQAEESRCTHLPEKTSCSGVLEELRS